MNANLENCPAVALELCWEGSEKFELSGGYQVGIVSSRGYQSYHSRPMSVEYKNMKVKVLPALQDNYMYLIKDESTNKAAAIDPVEPSKVVSVANSENAELTMVLTTHHHWDHAGGNNEMKKLVPGIEIVGGDDRIPGLTKKVFHNDTLNIGNLTVKCLYTPCHTKGHICYYVELEDESPAVFTGDTLFTGGCGRFFEGTASEMYSNLIEILGSLPDDTRVFSGHEYAVNNLNFAKHIDPNNKSVQKRLEWALRLRELNQPTVPSTIGNEKLTNPFMRVCDSYVQEIIGLANPICVMQNLRQKKDKFKV